jgi:hypothetical protein
MLSFLDTNGINMDCINQDVIDAGLGIARGEMNYPAVLEWVKKHKA